MIFSPYDIDYKIVRNIQTALDANVWTNWTTPDMTRRVLITASRAIRIRYGDLIQGQGSDRVFTLPQNQTRMFPIGRNVELGAHTTQAGTIQLTFLGGRQSWGARNTEQVKGWNFNAGQTLTLPVPDLATHIIVQNSDTFIFRPTWADPAEAATSNIGFRYDAIADTSPELHFIPVNPNARISIYSQNAQTIVYSFITDYGRDFQLLKPLAFATETFSSSSTTRLIPEVPTRTEFCKVQVIGGNSRMLIRPYNDNLPSSQAILRGHLLADGKAVLLPLRQGHEIILRGGSGQVGRVNAEFYRFGSVTAG